MVAEKWEMKEEESAKLQNPAKQNKPPKGTILAHDSLSMPHAPMMWTMKKYREEQREKDQTSPIL